MGNARISLTSKITQKGDKYLKITETRLMAEGEPVEKRNLRRAIAEKEKLLVSILEKLEQLKIHLSLLKREYDIRIGRLYLRLDEIDLEIVRYKKIADLLAKGYSDSEAMRKIDEVVEKRREEIKDEYKKINEEERERKGQWDVSRDERQELKRLWKKLAMQYHPDITHGDGEMMKKINKAYADGDLEVLRAIERNVTPEDTEVTTIETLREILEKLEQSVVKAEYEYRTLKKSDWFKLQENIKHARTKKRDLLGELTDKLLTEITLKENQLTELKSKYEK